MWNVARLARDMALPPTQKLLLMTLGSYADRDGANAHPGNVRLAADMGLSIRQVRRLLRELEGHGFIATQSRVGGRFHTVNYTLTLPAEKEDMGVPVSITKEDMGVPVSPPRKEDMGVPERRTWVSVKEDMGVRERASVPLLTKIDLDIDQEACASAHAREATVTTSVPHSLPAVILEPDLKTIYREYWESYPEEFYRERLFNPRSEWGLDKFLKANGRSGIYASMTPADKALWEPRYRRFCHEMKSTIAGGLTA